jgi:hypothetical protein
VKSSAAQSTIRYTVRCETTRNMRGTPAKDNRRLFILGRQLRESKAKSSLESL